MKILLLIAATILFIGLAIPALLNGLAAVFALIASILAAIFGKYK